MAAALARQGLLQEDIAAELGCLNQSVVSELLKTARAQGWSTTPVEGADGKSVDEGALTLSGPAILVANAALYAHELPETATWVWNVVADEGHNEDRWYAADLQEVLGEHVARALVTVVRTARKLGLDVPATLRHGKAVWAADQRVRVARERGAHQLWLEQRGATGRPVPAAWLAARSGLQIEDVKAAICAARQMAQARWFPPVGVQAALPDPDDPDATGTTGRLDPDGTSPRPGTAPGHRLGTLTGAGKGES